MSAQGGSGSARPTVRVRPGRRRLRRFILPSIAAVFALSAALRLGSGLGIALAYGAGQPSISSDVCVRDPGVQDLLEALRTRERKLTEREGIIADRSRALELADQRIQERLASLVAAEKELARTVSIADAASDGDVAQLVSVYENMKPKQAAPLFAEMAPEFAAGFLAKMRPDVAGAILANIDPATAYSISVILAGRNAGAPQN